MDSFKSIFILFLGFIIGILFFLNGLLINRSEISLVSECGPDQEYCHYSPYKRVILILVDALKYEFIDPHQNQSNYYSGNINIIRSLNSANKGKNVYMNHFVSDPPTTTLQRIKGITTGSLPTFIDMSTNFGSSELSEDNIINQWNKFGFDVKFVGDDTWTALFPQSFNTSRPYPSFNVKDLDSVDTGVQHFILDHLSRNTSGTNKRPEIILGHMLGVDHCGHTFGKDHPQMRRKLKELNQFLEKVVALMDKETLVVLFGDHGMTKSGDHGGDSPEEVDAALLMISEKPLNFHRLPSSSSLHHPRPLSQIDFVPTLAALTGVPIPFSNLGVLRTEMLTSTARATQYLEINFRQISHYISSYEDKFGSLHFPSSIRDFLAQPYNGNDTAHSIATLHSIQTHFRLKWAQFNVPLIYSSICACILHLLSLFSSLLTCKLPSHSSHLYRYIFYLFLTLIHFLFLDLFPSMFVVFLPFMFLEFFYLVKNVSFGSGDMVRDVDHKLSQFSVIAVTCCYFLVPFSNSFIVSEDSIVHYLLQTMLFVKSALCILHYFRGASSSRCKGKGPLISNMSLLLLIFVPTFIGSLSLSLGLDSKICREEQHCSWTPSSLSPQKCCFLICLVPVVVVFHRLWFTHSGNLASSACNTMCVKYLIPFSTLCLFFHQSIQFVEPSSRFVSVVEVTSLIFPRLALLGSLLSFMMVLINPLLMLHRPKFDVVRRSKVNVPCLFQYLRSQQSESHDTVVVHGLATIYSSAIFSALLATLILVSVFLKVQFVLGLIAVILFLLAFSALSAQLCVLNEEDLSASFPTWEMALVMTLLTQYGFFSTGHQATISNIPWYSVFVGWSGHHSTQIIPAIMLNVNIFSAHILISLCGLVLPLLILSISMTPLNIFSKHNNEKKKDDPTTNLGDFYFFRSDSAAFKFSSFIRRYFSIYLVFQSLLTLGTVISAGHSRRHLMAWKVFVPKMMYSVVGLLVVYVVTGVGYMLIDRVHRLAVHWRRRNT